MLENLFEEHYDFVILDTDIGELKGLEAIELIKKYRSRNTTIVVVTNDHSYETGERIAGMGVYYTLEKPIDQQFTKQLVDSFEKRVKKKN